MEKAQCDVTGCQHRQRAQRRRVAELAPCPASEQQHHGHRRQRCRQAGGELVHTAEQAVTGGSQPVGQRRLLKTQFAVEARRQVFAAGHHLARCLGHAQLLAAADRPRAQLPQAGQRRQQQRDGDHPPRRISHHTGVPRTGRMPAVLRATGAASRHGTAGCKPRMAQAASVRTDRSRNRPGGWRPRPAMLPHATR